MRRVSIAMASIVALSALLLVSTGCENWHWPGDEKKAMAEPSLYDRLGGESAIAAVVDDFVNRGAADPKVNFTRKGTPMEWNASPENVAMLKKRITQFVCKVAGGPQKYEGRSMKEAHKGMGITSAEFDALAADLAASLDKFKVPAREKGELLAAVASTKPDIVEKM